MTSNEIRHERRYTRRCMRRFLKNLARSKNYGAWVKVFSMEALATAYLRVGKASRNSRVKT